MITLDLIQGSQEWHAKRLQCFTASEASAMMGASKYQTRDQLLNFKSSGVAEEIDSAKQKLFKRGHDAEEFNRPAIEAMIGQELYPVTGFAEIEGLPLLASFDGITMDETIIYEHKLINQSLVASIRAENLELYYAWQLEQQLLVSGAEKVIFTCGDESEGVAATMTYYPVPGRKEQLIAGWHQFAKDLETFMPTAKAEKVIAEPVESLPSVNYTIDFSNGISINSNLDVFKQAAQELVERSKAILVTDQDFENAKARVKQCDTAEKNITSLIQRVLGELGDVNKFKEDMESIKEWIRQSRLNQDKQIKERTAIRKAEILGKGRGDAAAYVAKLNTDLARISMPQIPIDLDGAIYKKSSFSSMESAVNDAIAKFKIQADKMFMHIRCNLLMLDTLAEGHMELFRDLQQLCEKDTDSLEAIIKVRIGEFKAKEIERIEAEAKRIADAKIAEEADRVAAEAKRVAESEKVETPAFVGNQDFAPTASNDEPVVRPAVRRGYEGYAPTAAAPNKIFTATADDFINIIAMHFLCDAEVAETRILKAFKEYLTV